MKPGYKIIIAALLVYGGVKVKALMDVAPYKERASTFMRFLKEKKPFEAQAMLSQALQKQIPIERLYTLAQTYALAQSREIDWSEWEREDGRYILQGDVVFSDSHRVPVRFLFLSSEGDEKVVGEFTLGERRIKPGEESSMLDG